MDQYLRIDRLGWRHGFFCGSNPTNMHIQFHGDTSTGHQEKDFGVQSMLAGYWFAIVSEDETTAGSLNLTILRMV